MVRLTFQESFGDVFPTQNLTELLPQSCTFFPTVSYMVSTVLKTKSSGGGWRTKKKLHQEENEFGEEAGSQGSLTFSQP